VIIRFTILIFSLSGILLSCNNKPSEMAKGVSTAVIQGLDDINIEARVTTFFSNDTFVVDIEYCNRYFIHESTCEYLRSYIIFLSSSHLSDETPVLLFTSYCDLNKGVTEMFDMTSTGKYESVFNENVMFLDIFKKVISQINAQQDVGYNGIVELLRETLPERNIPVSFWHLIQSYTSEACEGESFQRDNLLLLKKGIEFQDGKLEGHIIDDILSTAKSYCG